MSGVPSSQSVPPPAASKEAGGEARAFRDVFQWLGISGDAFGTSGRLRRTLKYGFWTAAVMVGVINTINIITVLHERPDIDWRAPIIWEGSSWIALLLFFWVPWVFWRIAPPFGRQRWRLLAHIPGALLFAFLHVGTFVLLREFAYWLAGSHYDFGPFFPTYLYELRKDALGYALFIAGFTLFDHLLQQQHLIDIPGQTLTFDIRDGARLNRVRLEEVLAIASAGNYVEFVLRDGRKLMMRSPLSALEDELGPRGFLRTHRSWLVNAKAMTALKPEGSGDYTVELGDVEAPLSRRFPDALARLRGE